MAEINEAQFERRLLLLLLRPSYISALVAILIVVLVLGSAVLTALYWSDGAIASALQSISASNQSIIENDQTTGESPVSAVLLFLFWALIGLAVYYVVIGIAHALSEVREVRASISDVNANRASFLRTFAEKTGTRLLGLVLLFTAVALLLRTVLPYSLQLGQTLTLDIQSFGLLILSGVMLLVVLHVITIAMRLIVLRPRLFSSEI